MDKIIQCYFILHFINYFLVQKSFNHIKNSYALEKNKGKEHNQFFQKGLLA